MALLRAFGWLVLTVATAACTTPERNSSAGRSETAAARPTKQTPDGPTGRAERTATAQPPNEATAEPQIAALELELRLSTQGSRQVRSNAPISLVLKLVNRSGKAAYWLGGWATPPVVRISAQWEDAGQWVDAAATPVESYCGKPPFSWTTPVNPLQPGEAWIFEDEFAATTARCAGAQTKFIGFEFPRLGRARIVARYVHPGQQPGKSAHDAPQLPPFELVSEPLEVQVVP